jgi:hypothetical protein
MIINENKSLIVLKYFFFLREHDDYKLFFFWQSSFLQKIKNVFFEKRDLL